jgi:hypothetical protein
MKNQAINIENIFTSCGSVRSHINRGTIITNGRSRGIFVGQHPASGSVWIAWNMDRKSFAIMCDRLDAITLKHAEKYLCPADDMDRYNDFIYANPFNINCKGTLLKPRSRERASTTGHFKNGKIALVAYFSGYSYTDDAYVRNRKVVLYMPQGDDARRASFDLDGYGDRYERENWKSNVFMMIQDRSERNNFSIKECYEAGDLMFEIEDGGFYGPLEMDLTITAKIDLSENSIFEGKYRELI